jgi:hypothetical protein
MIISFRKVAMKRQSSSKASKTKWARVRSMKERDVKLTAEHPEADVKQRIAGRCHTATDSKTERNDETST